MNIPVKTYDFVIIGSGFGGSVSAMRLTEKGYSVLVLERGLRFEDQARALLLAGDHQPLIDYESMGQDAVLSVPTPDHYLPFLYVIALQSKDEPVSFPVEGFDGGSISMLAVKTG